MPDKGKQETKSPTRGRQEGKTFRIGRDAKDGRFTSIERARKHPRDHVVERVQKPGRGDTKKK